MSGTSANEHRDRVVFEVLRLDPRCIVDVGCGQGTYGDELRGAGYRGRLVGVEAWQPNALAAARRGLYDSIFTVDVRALPEEELAGADVILAIDVVEHFDKAEGVALLARLRRHAPVLVSVPIVPYPQGELDGNPYEIHRHDWTIGQMYEAGGYTLATGDVTGLFLFTKGP